MGNHTEIIKTEFLADFVSKLNVESKWVEIAQAKAGSKNFTRATYFDTITVPDVERLLAEPMNLSFLAGVRPKDDVTLRQEVNRCTKDADALEKHIVSLDIDLKDVVKAVVDAPAINKWQIAKAAYLQKIHGALTQLAGGVWIGSHSGNGVHVHFYSKTLLKFESKKEYSAFYLALVERVEKAVFDGRQRFDRQCANAGRLMRVPYSTNLKNKRAPVPTSVIHHDPNADASDFLYGLLQEVRQLREKEKLASEQAKTERSDDSSDSNEHRERLRSALTFRSILAHCGYSKMSSIKEHSDGFYASSPWKSDENPSCNFHEREGYFKDFVTEHKGDKFTLIAKLKGLDPRCDFVEVIKIAEEITGIKKLEARKTEKAKTTMGKVVSSERYFKFFEECPYAPFRRNIFSGDLMTFTDGAWHPVHAHLGAIRSCALDKKLNKDHVSDHLSRYALDKKPELLIDVPEWDGVDRLSIMADALTIKNLSDDAKERKTICRELVFDWAAKTWKRIFNPKVQNRILILKGDQGAGKDTWAGTLTAGFGQFAAEVDLNDNHKEVLNTVTDLGIIRISEYDKTSRTQVPFLKSLITAEHTNVRKPYDRSAKMRAARFSFIATCNVDDILRDYTGNRRYIILDVEKIAFNYPQDASLQLLAQFRHLAEVGFTTSGVTEKALKDYLAQHTPEDPKLAVLDYFDERIAQLENTGRTEFSPTEISDIFLEIQRTFDWKVSKLQNMLKSNGRFRRTGTKRLYFRLRKPEDADEHTTKTSSECNRVVPITATPKKLSLVEAVKSGDWGEVFECLKRGENPNGSQGESTPLNETPLYHAVQRNELSLVRMLIKWGARAYDLFSYSDAPFEKLSPDMRSALEHASLGSLESMMTGTNH